MKLQHILYSLALLLLGNISFLGCMDRDLGGELQDGTMPAQNTESYDDTTECPTCMESFDDKKKLGVALQPCDHFFCKECLEQWKEKNAGKATCPTCRQDFSSFELLANKYHHGKDSQTACSICQESYKRGDDIDRFFCQNHIFHAKCINQHILTQAENATCPECRAIHPGLGNKISHKAGGPKPDPEGKRLAHQLQDEINRGDGQRAHRFGRRNPHIRQDASSPIYRGVNNIPLDQPVDDDFMEELLGGSRFPFSGMPPYPPGPKPGGMPAAYQYQPKAAPVPPAPPSKRPFGLALELLTATAMSSLIYQAWAHDSYTNQEPGIRIASIAGSLLSFFVAQKVLGKLHPARYDNPGKTTLCWALGSGLGGFVLPKIFKKKTDGNA